MNTDEAGSTSEMQAEDASVEPMVHWVTLADFKVEVLGYTKVNAKCYRNTRQQVPIKVTLDARDENGVQVSLTDKQMQEIRLCHYESGEPMGGWSRAKDVYEYNFVPTREDGSEIPPLEDDDLPGVKENTITLYMATSMVEKKLDAFITSPTGVVYRARDFDSWINVVGVEVVIHKYSAFELVNRGGPEFPFQYDVDMYYLRFNANNTQFSIRGSEHLDWPADWPHYSWSKDGWREKAHMAYRVGERRQMDHAGASFPVNDVIGQANIARISNNVHPPGNRDIKPRVVYYDQHGNPGMVRYVNSSNGNTIHLQDAGDPPRDPEIYGE